MIDITTIRIIILCLATIGFVGLCIWIFLPSRKKSYQEASRLILDELKEPNSQHTVSGEVHK